LQKVNIVLSILFYQGETEKTRNPLYKKYQFLLFPPGISRNMEPTNGETFEKEGAALKSRCLYYIMKETNK
jgi:hypothetical protein